MGLMSLYEVKEHTARSLVPDSNVLQSDTI